MFLLGYEFLLFDKITILERSLTSHNVMESLHSINTNQNYSVCNMGQPKVIKLLTADEEAIKNLEQELNDRQEDRLQVRQALAQSMAALKRQERKYAESASQAEEAATLKAGLDKQSKQVELLKKNLVEIETKIIEAKNNREIFKARLQSAQTQQDVEQVTSN